MHWKPPGLWKKAEMETPIRDFVRTYGEKETLRLHMPGHKGKHILGVESLDITEIEGADVLYHAEGIIKESEHNAAELFGSAATFYSTEGSSLCIRAMLTLALLWAKEQGRPPQILAGRNAHKTFLTGAALLDVEVEWLIPRGSNLLSCPVTGEELETVLTGKNPPAAVYLTTPDYLGNRLELRELAEVCHRHHTLLLVDNAHGAYLHFLSEPCHPMDLGVDICCDSAHKTLPVLTGGAYLHISKTAPAELAEQAETALSLFASTSPSYLILQSLDEANRYLAEDFPQELSAFLPSVENLRSRLTAHGFRLGGGEPLKLTLQPKSFGYTGLELAEILRAAGMEPEFADPDHLVLMLTPALTAEELERLGNLLVSLSPKPPIPAKPPALSLSRRVLSPRQALFSPQEELPAENCLGRVLAAPTVSCPPAVPILICGEEIDQTALNCFRYYGISHCSVVKT